MSFAWRVSVSGYRHNLRNSTQKHSGHYTKKIEWKDINWLAVKSGGLRRHTNLRQNPVPLGGLPEERPMTGLVDVGTWHWWDRLDFKAYLKLVQYRTGAWELWGANLFLHAPAVRTYQREEHWWHYSFWGSGNSACLAFLFRHLPFYLSVIHPQNYIIYHS